MLEPALLPLLACLLVSCTDKKTAGGTDTGMATNCSSFGYTDTTSAIACLPTCGGFDLSACTNPSARCADPNRNWGRAQCEDTDLKNQTCETLGYASGTLSCNANCSFNLSGCVL